MKKSSVTANKWQESCSTRKLSSYLALVSLLGLLACCVSGVSGQYGAGGEKYGGQMSATGYEHASKNYYPHQEPSYQSAVSSYGDEPRSKVQLGIRLRIPAMKFELPRFNMPKITISAKIRQPEKPRTIQLPEINLDTSSRLTPPGAGQPNGRSKGHDSQAAGYGPTSSYGHNSDGQTTSQLSFSSGADDERGTDYASHQPIDHQAGKSNQTPLMSWPAYGASDLHSTFYTVSQQTVAPTYHQPETFRRPTYEPQVIQHHHQQQIKEPPTQQQQEAQFQQQQRQPVADSFNEFEPEKHLAEMGFNQAVQIEPTSSRRAQHPLLASWRHRAQRFAFSG